MVETLAAGLLSTIVAGALLSTLTLTNSLIRESAANQSLGLVQTVVTDQLRNHARKAFGAKAPGEDPEAAFDANPSDDAAQTNQLGIVFCDAAGAPFARYRINTADAILEEWDPDLSEYVPFRIGERIVQVDAASRFGILAGRGGATFKIACRIQADIDYTFPVIEDTVLCRNK